MKVPAFGKAQREKEFEAAPASLREALRAGVQEVQGVQEYSGAAAKIRFSCERSRRRRSRKFRER